MSSSIYSILPFSLVKIEVPDSDGRAKTRWLLGNVFASYASAAKKSRREGGNECFPLAVVRFCQWRAKRIF